MRKKVDQEDLVHVVLWSWTVAIDIIFLLNVLFFCKKNVFPCPLSTVQLIGKYFNNNALLFSLFTAFKWTLDTDSLMGCYNN